MKILVFDDSEIHRESARVTLKGHELTIVGTYDEAQDELTSKIDEVKEGELRKNLVTRAGFREDQSPWDSLLSPEDKKKVTELWLQAREMASTHHNFDVVMTDLLVPASSQNQGSRGQRFVGQEMPIGSIIALLALTVGVKKVAVVTDTDHHSHPASAAFDCFSDCMLPGIKIACLNSVSSGGAKDWGRVLDMLIS